MSKNQGLVAGLVALGVIAAAVAALFLLPQGRPVRAKIADTTSQGLAKGKELASGAMHSVQERFQSTPELETSY